MLACWLGGSRAGKREEEGCSGEADISAISRIQAKAGSVCRTYLVASTFDSFVFCITKVDRDDERSTKPHFETRLAEWAAEWRDGLWDVYDAAVWMGSAHCRGRRLGCEWILFCAKTLDDVRCNSYPGRTCLMRGKSFP